jgi:ATP-dependent DNA helicase RecQ
MQTLEHKIKTGLGSKAQLPELPVLVVDDVVDSGWTLTVAALLLREHGSGPVYPFALARASLRGS